MIYPLDSDLKPVVTGRMFDKLLEDKRMQKIEYRRCQVEPWYWLVNYVFTKRKDENVEGAEVERFPADPYLRYVFDMCFREPKLAIDKSRQMRLTWIMMAYELFWAQFYPNEEIICQTKAEAIADSELVKRAVFMFENQPIWMRQAVLVNSYCTFGLQNKSIIRGIPSGAHKVRAYNPTRGFIDETGFLEGEFEECKNDMLACCKDVKLVSSAMAGEWGDFVNAA
uniref:Putative terminase n=1 Tax=viral metagenome TaxID=1070528 RepID=A0A6M3XGM3_9ZZZZ